MVGLSVPVLRRLCAVLFVSVDYLLAGETQASDATGVAVRLSKLPPEHIRNVEEILNRYIEGMAISRQGTGEQSTEE